MPITPGVGFGGMYHDWDRKQVQNIRRSPGFSAKPLRVPTDPSAPADGPTVQAETQPRRRCGYCFRTRSEHLRPKNRELGTWHPVDFVARFRGTQRPMNATTSLRTPCLHARLPSRRTATQHRRDPAPWAMEPTAPRHPFIRHDGTQSCEHHCLQAAGIWSVFRQESGLCWIIVETARLFDCSRMD